MGLENVVRGPKGSVVKFVRANGRCPADEFLSGCDEKMRRRFEGSFGGLTQIGSKYCNQERFKPLSGEGKPIWEFKEHDHRLMCHRLVDGESVTVVLLSGWVKDKRGRTKEEDREIGRAKNLLAEFLAEQKGSRR